VLDFPEYDGYTCPEYFRDDWLNAYHDAQRRRGAEAAGSVDGHCQAATDTGPEDPGDATAQRTRSGYNGYRFVYLGPQGSSTAVHSDVFRSFSWSINLAGRKHWRFLPPQYAHLLQDKCGVIVCFSVGVSSNPAP
jgi:hypothetical protein